jgi:FkbM family methyltransferase
VNAIYEWVRCGRHNLLHLRFFRIGYSAGRWTCRYGRHRWVFPYYPYLAFHDIEGYLRDGRLVPRPGMTVIDAGACYGEYALFASALVGPKGRVIMVEPDPANRAMARRLFAMNGSPANISIYEGGLWNAPGEVSFTSGLGPQSTVVAPGIDDHARTLPGTTPDRITIPVQSLAGLAESHGLDRLDLVKMDVEGAELQIVEGARSLPHHLRPAYAVASYHVVDGVRTAVTLERMFAAMDYESCTGNPRHPTTWAWPAGAPR